MASEETLSSGVNIVDGAWHHCVIVCAYPSLHFYIDRVNVVSRTMTFDNVADTQIRRFAHGADDNSYQGRVDEFGMWNRALDADEVSALYNDGLGRGMMYKPNVIGMTNPVMATTLVTEVL